MAEALVSGLLRSGLFSPRDISVSDVSEARLSYIKEKCGVDVRVENTALAKSAEIIVLAVKPGVVGQVLAEVGPLISKEQLLVSIAAGVKTSFLESFLSSPVPVVRVMPNTPCLVGEGASVVCPGRWAKVEHVELAKRILSAAGRVVEVPETLMDCVTGLCGSGPAYMYLVIEAMADGAVRLGLARDKALLLAAQTMLGAAKMVLETGEHPVRLRDMVTTPGGTTIEGLFELEKGALRAVIMKAIASAARRAGELSLGE